MNGRLALVRAAHLNDYIAVLRDIGVPVDRKLARSLLPPRIEETPDLYVSVPVALEWIAQTGHDLHLMELGLRGAQQASLASLRPAQQAAIMTAQTGLKRLEALADLSRHEDSTLEMSIRQQADDVRVICTMAGLGSHPSVCLAEWLNLQGVISVVRSVAGPSWYPNELCFVSRSKPPEAVLAAFPNTRILVGQPHSSILVARIDLARPTDDAIASAHDPAASSSAENAQDVQSDIWGFISLLRKMVEPYLNGGRPDVAFVAEIAGVSPRTLQRRLTLCGSSYSQILQEARFERACSHLADPAMKVIDVAFMAGYDSPQHFTRAFHRFTGVTPTAYRSYILRSGTEGWNA